MFDPFLEYVTLFFGVFIGIYSVSDIYDGMNYNSLRLTVEARLFVRLSHATLYRFLLYHCFTHIDLVTRTADGSDAVACHQMWPCCHPRCVGVQFWFVAFAFQVLGLYVALVFLVSNGK